MDNSKLINKLPFFYNNEITKPIIDAEEIERDVLFEEIEDTLKQCFVSTATWGLEYWEKMLCLPVNTGKTYAERRSIIYARMRGTRTTTVEVVKQIAMSFFETENIEIIEENSNYVFNIVFENSKFESSNLNDLYKTIDIYKPAHLNYYLTFTNKGQIQIISKFQDGFSKLPVCNITKVGTYWKTCAEGIFNKGQVIQAKSQDGFSKLPICNIDYATGENAIAIVGVSRVGSAVVGGE